MAHKKPYIIAVTGTKGKTTIVRLLSHVYTRAGRPTLRVDTDGYYLNEEQKGNMEDSLNLYGYGPAVCPGKHLLTLQKKSNSIAILEAVFACYTAGTGYRRHHIGIFTNVFEDHVGRRIKTRRQLAQEKSSFIFGRLTPGGTAIFNADDKYVCDNLKAIKRNRSINLLPVGHRFKYFDLPSHLSNAGQAVIFIPPLLGIKTASTFLPLIDVTKVPWTFGGSYWPSIQNLMFAAAAIYTEQGNQLPASLAEIIYNYRLSKHGGRLTLIKNKPKQIAVLLDFAHDKYSLLAVSDLARKLAPHGKTIGVVRLHPDRTDSAIVDTGHAIANAFDSLVVYDKIDGHNRLVYHDPVRRIKRGPGETSGILFRSISQSQDKNHHVWHKIAENTAVAKAFSLARPGDIVVHIVNDNHAQSLKLVQQYLHS